ncbi:hypothetical protein Bca4012_016613 [Brassica carinata]
MKTEDVTVKRASTGVESASPVSNKLKIEDEDDTSMEEEEEEEEEESDSDNSGLWSVEEEEDDEVDSYDGYECVFDPDGPEGFSSDKAYAEFRVYKINAWKNRVASVHLEDIWKTTTKRQYLADIASLCVKRLNEEKGTAVEFVTIVRGNLKVGGGWKLYITFMAREYPNGPLLEYQAKAMDFGGIPLFPILCRPASTIS